MFNKNFSSILVVFSTLIMLTGKVFGYFDESWWIVFAPVLVYCAYWFLMVILFLILLFCGVKNEALDKFRIYK